jgi:hypothetical protein
MDQVTETYDEDSIFGGSAIVASNTEDTYMVNG